VKSNPSDQSKALCVSQLTWGCVLVYVCERWGIVIPHFHDVFRFWENPGSILFKNWIKRYNWFLLSKNHIFFYMNVPFFVSFWVQQSPCGRTRFSHDTSVTKKETSTHIVSLSKSLSKIRKIICFPSLAFLQLPLIKDDASYLWIFVSLIRLFSA
jgi:hypothetical protein